MAPTLTLVLLWLGFGGSHVLLSSRALRPRLVGALGLAPFLGLYSLVAFAFFVPLVWTYFAHEHAGPVLWTLALGPGGRWAIYVGMGVAFVLVASSFFQASPAGMAPAKSTPYGVTRITRHPQNMGFALFGVLHCIPNGAASDLAFFGGLALFAVLGSWHQERRKLAEGAPGLRELVASAPFVPFTGRETLRGLRELSPVAVALGVAATVLVRHFHARWFGG
jgi:uncharacterized membrane protein